MEDHLGNVSTQPPDFKTDYQSGELFGVIKDDPQPLSGATDLLTFDLEGVHSTFRIIGPANVIADTMKAAAGQRWKLAGLFSRGRGGRNSLRLGGTYWYAKRVPDDNSDSNRRDVQLDYRSWESAVINRDINQSWPVDFPGVIENE